MGNKLFTKASHFCPGDDILERGPRTRQKWTLNVKLGKSVKSFTSSVADPMRSVLDGDTLDRDARRPFLSGQTSMSNCADDRIAFQAIGANLAEARKLDVAAPDSAIDSSETEATADAEFDSATASYYAGAFDVSMTAIARAIAVFSELNLPIGEAKCRALVSRILQLSGDLSGALQEALGAQSLAEQSGDHHARYTALIALSNVYFPLAQWDQAVAHGERAAELARLIGDDLLHGRALDTLGCIWGGKADEARKACDEEAALHCATESAALSQRACQIARHCGNRRLEGTALANAAEAIAFLGRLEDAQSLMATWPLDPDRDSAFIICHHLDTWGGICLRLGRHQEAVSLFRRALATAKSKSAVMRSNAHLADALERVGDFGAALAHFKLFHSLYVQTNSETAQRSARVATVRMDTVAALARVEELSRSNEQLNRRAEDLSRLSLEDPLTGLPNRRALDSVLGAGEQGWALAMIDVDHFKNVNDTYSHLVGDKVLRRLAMLLRGCCRSTDMPVRWGGEEFAILLRPLSEGDAAAASERVRATVQAYDWGSVALGLSVTVSIGVAAGNAVRPIDEVLLEADENLYIAKRAGRNRVVA